MMGKLIILSGPSGVGKGPLTNVLQAYYDSTGKKFVKHVLYTSRKQRTGEREGVTYYFRSRKEIENLGFHTYRVRGSEQMQAIDFDELEKQLCNNDVVFLEIYHEQVKKVIDFCIQRSFQVKRIFISPLSEDDFDYFGCQNDVQREIAVRAVMKTKLMGRGTEIEENIKKRAGNAFDEIKMNDREDVITFVNSYGEDNADTWQQLEQLLSNPKGVGVLNTFKRFVDEIEHDDVEFQPMKLFEETLAATKEEKEEKKEEAEIIEFETVKPKEESKIFKYTVDRSTEREDTSPFPILPHHTLSNKRKGFTKKA